MGRHTSVYCSVGQRLLLIFLFIFYAVPNAQAATDANSICGTYPGRVLTELALHRQYAAQRVRSGYLPQSFPPTGAVDVGNIAVLPDDGTLVTTANAFDLDQKKLSFQSVGAGYTVLAEAGALDTEAANQGILLNPPPASNPQNIGDDGTREISIGFSFPFFGRSYTTVFINSDGNLTFLAGDTATSQRSLSRFLSGPPRMAPYFADLDPSVAGQLSYFSSPSRFVVTWNQVPDYSPSGVGPRETFQVILTPDGRIQFAYNGINGVEAVVGISPGSFTEALNPVDLSAASGSQTLEGPVAEVFTASTRLDLAAVAQRFYRTHEDAYEFLVVFTNFDFDLSGAFAFEVNVSNRVTGIGAVSNPPVFDFSSEFGSSRLESLVNMGNLSRYPADPATVFLRGVDSTLSLLGQEAGHRFLVYVPFQDPEGPSHSAALLGRDLQHWSFLFNSDASVMEGNRIRDNSDGTFTTIGVVERYNEIDQYLMGLRAPEEVGTTFLVKDPNVPLNPGRSPAKDVTFAGRRADVLLDQIIASNGPRFPNTVVSPKKFNFAFVLVVPRGSTPSLDQISHLERIRQAWEPFFAQAASFRGTANTALLRGLRIKPSPLGLFSGSQQQGEIELLAATSSGVIVRLNNSNPSALAVPPFVVIPGGARSASFPITALSRGRAFLEATAPGFEASTAVVEVLDPQLRGSLSLTITGGNNQVGQPGTSLPQPLQVTLRDSNQIPYPGVPVEFAVIAGDASLSASGVATDAQGNASAGIRLGEATGPVTVIASIPGTSLSARFSLSAVGSPQVPRGGVANGASFAPGSAMLSPGSLISIFGTNLSATTALVPSSPLPTTRANTSVEIAGIAAPLFYVSPTQINAQVPFELPPSTVSLRVHNGASVSSPVSIFLQAVGPGIFTRDSSGKGPGAITHATSQLPVSAERPATPGEFVQLFATGLGGVAPAVPSGRPAPSQPLSPTTSPVTVTMNGVPAPVVFSGLAPGLVGLYQVNAQVPEVAPGTAEVILTVNGVSSNAVTLEVGRR